MLYLSQILQKETIDAETAEKIGEASALVWDNVTKNCLLQTENRLFADVKCNGKAVKVANAVVFLDNADDENSRVQRFYRLFIGQRVFDTNGKFVGEVTDVSLTQNLRLLTLRAGENTFKRAAISVVGDVVLVKEKSARQIEVEKAKRNLQNESLQKTTGQNETTAPEKGASKTPPAQKGKPATYGIRRIRKHYGDFNFLIGKTVDKNIVNFQGELMLKKGETITKDILRQAKISGKLIELYLHIE